MDRLSYSKSSIDLEALILFLSLLSSVALDPSYLTCLAFRSLIYKMRKSNSSRVELLGELTPTLGSCTL